MKKVIVVMAVFLFFAGFGAVVYCQDESADDSAIEQSESEMGDNLDSEISDAQVESEDEMCEMETSMDTGNPMQ